MTAAVIKMREPCHSCQSRGGHVAVSAAAHKKGVIVTECQPWLVRCAVCADINYTIEPQ